MRVHLDKHAVVLLVSFIDGETSSVHDSGVDVIHFAPWGI